MKNNNSTQNYNFENELIKNKKIELEVSYMKNYNRNNLINYLIKLILNVKEILKYIRTVSLNFNKIAELNKYKDTKKIKSCIVFGNGPSQGVISSEFLKKFKNEKNGELIVINFFTANKIFEEILPDYIILSDPDVINENLDRKYEKINSKNIELMNYLDKHQSVKIFCPVDQSDRFIKKFNEDRLIFFIDNEFNLLSFTDPRLPRGYSSNTILKALSICNFFGYKEKYLIGLDNTPMKNIFVDNKNHLIVKNDYAFREDEYHKQKIPSQMYNYLCSYQQLYRELYNIFSRYDFINLDKFSLVDCFKKIDDPIDIFKINEK